MLVFYCRLKGGLLTSDLFLAPLMFTVLKTPKNTNFRVIYVGGTDEFVNTVDVQTCPKV